MIPQSTMFFIPHTDVLQDPAWNNLRIIHAQTEEHTDTNEDSENINKNLIEAFRKNSFEFQSPGAGYSTFRCTLTKKGVSGEQQRIVAVAHPNLGTFIELVKYDPSNPMAMNYEALGMAQMHQQTQSDFKGQKSLNKSLFVEYLQEGARGERTLYLPTISGWQSSKVFDKTIFVSYDDSDPNALYGQIYLPKDPIMQADGQTQTAALFGLAYSKEGQDISLDIHKKLQVTLEIELNVDVDKAAQSFADRNGRGSKKNKNLVSDFDNSAAISQLRKNAIQGTIFENRVANGRNTSTTETATQNIVDLSTLEQMLIYALTGKNLKPEAIKHFHIKHLQSYANEFIRLLEENFGTAWAEKTAPNFEPFRKLYVHGWPFTLKALAIAYYQSRIDEIFPYSASIGARDVHFTDKEAYENQITALQAGTQHTPQISYDEFKNRLKRINWLRYSKSWVTLTGPKMQNGQPKKIKLKGIEGEKVLGQAQNTATIISAVADKILSKNWIDLTATEDFE